MLYFKVNIYYFKVYIFLYIISKYIKSIYFMHTQIYVNMAIVNEF